MLGGATVSVFASIAMTGMKLVASAEMDYRNSSIVGLAAALGVGVSQANAALATLPSWVTTIFGKSPVVLATIIAVCLNLILPKSRDEKKEEKIHDSRFRRSWKWITRLLRMRNKWENLNGKLNMEEME